MGVLYQRDPQCRALPPGVTSNLAGKGAGDTFQKHERSVCPPRWNARANSLSTRTLSCGAPGLERTRSRHQKSTTFVPKPLEYLMQNELNDRLKRFMMFVEEEVLQAPLTVTLIPRPGGRSPRLTPTEHDLLAALWDAGDRAISARRLVQKVWGERAVSETALRVSVSRLREKLLPLGVGVATTARGGYQLTFNVTKK